MPEFLQRLRTALGALFAVLCACPLATAQIAFNEPVPKDPLRLTNKVGILVVVNDEPITDVDLAYRINLDLQTTNTPNTNENRAAAAASSLDNLIFDRIVIKEAEQIGFRVANTDLQRGLGDIARRNNQTPTAFLDSLAESGVPANTFYDLLRGQFAWRALSGRAVSEQAAVSDADVDAELARINSLRGRRERQMSEIFLPYSRFGSREQTITRANALITQLKSGAVSFSDLAKQNSFSPTAGLGGRMGWVPEGTLDPILEQGLAGLFAGQITEPPLEGRDGVYIFGIQNTRPIGAANSRTLVRLYQLFRNIPQNQQSYDAQQDFVILNSATLEVQNCTDFTTYINTYGDVGSGDMGVIDLSALPPGISQVLAQLPEGQPSAVLPVPNGGSVFMICGRSEEIDPVTREQVEERLRNERLEALTTRYERDLRRQAVIDYRF